MNMISAAIATARALGCKHASCPKPVLCSENCKDASICKYCGGTGLLQPDHIGEDCVCVTQKRSPSVVQERNQENDPVFLIYRLTMRGHFVPSLVYGDQLDAAGKSRIGTIISTDPTPGDIVHLQRIDPNLSLLEASLKHPCIIGTNNGELK